MKERLSGINFIVIFLSFLLLLLSFPSSASAAEKNAYIGSKACSACHEEQYDSFMKHSKKAHSWNAIAIMKPKLKETELEKCYECHTTGYKNNGFKSIESTPELADVGCETCHGPGSEHAATQDPEKIIHKPSVETCTACHSSERIQDFKFKPLIFSGAH